MGEAAEGPRGEGGTAHGSPAGPAGAAPDERLQVLRLVASGKVGPEEALQLLRALEPDVPPAPAGWAGWREPPPQPSHKVLVLGQAEAARRPAGVALHVTCELDDKECEFTVPLEAAAQIAAMLPPAMAERIPPRMLEQLPRVVQAGKGELRYQDDDFELTVRREQREAD